MDFNEIVAAVVSITKRPDKIGDIGIDVNATVSQCCLGTTFARDLQEEILSIDAAEYTQSVALSTLTRFRKFEYVRPPAYKCTLTKVDPTEVFSGGVEKLDAYYVAGNNVVFKLSKLSATLAIGYYQYPPVLTSAAPTFWLLDVAPYMIIKGAAARLFRTIGDDTSAQQQEGDFRLLYDTAKNDFKSGVTGDVR